MANGTEYVNWTAFNDHVKDSNNGFSRLSTVETKVDNLEEGQHEMKQAIQELQKTVWRASGMAIAAIAIIELALKIMK